MFLAETLTQKCPEKKLSQKIFKNSLIYTRDGVSVREIGGLVHVILLKLLKKTQWQMLFMGHCEVFQNKYPVKLGGKA